MFAARQGSLLTVFSLELAVLGRHGAFAGGYAFGVGPLLWIVWLAAASACMTLNTHPALTHHRASRPWSASRRRTGAASFPPHATARNYA